MKRLLWGGAGSALTVALLACCGASSAPQEDNKPTNPQQGWVPVWSDDNSTDKRCDGSTLIYWRKVGYGGGLTAIPNSPECK